MPSLRARPFHIRPPMNEATRWRLALAKRIAASYAAAAVRAARLEPDVSADAGRPQADGRDDRADAAQARRSLGAPQEGIPRRPGARRARAEGARSERDADFMRIRLANPQKGGVAL